MNTVFTRRSRLIVLLSWGAAWATVTDVRAQVDAPADHAAVLAPFLADDTLAVAFIDLSKIDPAALVSTVLGPNAANDPVNLPATQAAALVHGMLDGLRNAGAERCYVLAGIGDARPGGGPLAVLPIADRAAQTRVTEQLRAVIGMIQSMAGGGQQEIRIERHPAGTLVVGSPSAVDHYSLRLSTDRPDLAEPLSRLASAGAALALVASPGPDSRRVIRELWPELPPPVTALNGDLLGNRLRRVEFLLKLPPAPAVQAVIETTDPAAAATVRELFDAGAAELARENRNELAKTLRSFLDLLEVRTEETRLTLQLPTEGAALSQVREAVARAVESARDSGIRQRRASALRRIMIALLNHESATRTLPAAAIRDEEGKPLLSWRVRILPVIGQQALYSQFKLEEPWDSPHNIALVKRMPQEFADPDPKLAALAREGKTTYQVPIGPQTVFYKNEGTRISEITDGTSVTIAVVEVVPEQAVEWTRPADWEVNMQDPLSGVRRTDREGFWAARCDGSVHFIPNDIEPDALRALLTRAAKDPVR